MRLPKNICVVYKKYPSKEHNKTISEVKRTLDGIGADYTIIERGRMKRNSFTNKDLIIAVGGDGTFLRVSHFLDRQLILGVNSDIKKNEAFFMQATRHDFGRKIKTVLNGKYKIRKLPRLKAVINGKQVKDLALNEYYVGHRNAYSMSRYNLIIGKKKAFHRSSGLLVGTGPGSTAWLLSAGGAKNDVTSTTIQYIAREVYNGRLIKKEMSKGTVSSRKSITVESLSDNNIVVADSLSEEYSLKKGQKVSIMLSRHPLYALWF